MILHPSNFNIAYRNTHPREFLFGGFETALWDTHYNAKLDFQPLNFVVTMQMIGDSSPQSKDFRHVFWSFAENDGTCAQFIVREFLHMGYPAVNVRIGFQQTNNIYTQTSFRSVHIQMY